MTSTYTPPRHPTLTPVRLGGLELANRLAVAPMTRVSATADGVPTQQMADYYAAFARGGFGLIITEGTYTDLQYSQGYLNQPGAVTDAQLAGWRCRGSSRPSWPCRWPSASAGGSASRPGTALWTERGGGRQARAGASSVRVAFLTSSVAATPSGTVRVLGPCPKPRSPMTGTPKSSNRSTTS